MPLLHNYNFKLFETLSNNEFGELYNISRQAANQLRRRHAPETHVESPIKIQQKQNQKKIDEKILEYIKNFPNSIKIIDFLKLNNYSPYITVDKNRFIKIAKENNIEFSFYILSKYNHGCRCQYRKCNCEIYKLTNSIHQYFRCRKRKCSTKQKDYLANEYLELYKNDKSRYKKEFWNFILEKVET